MRRHPRVRTLAAAALIALAGCGGGGDEPAEGEQPAPAASAPSKSAGSKANLKKFFGVESAKIDYAYTGATEGTETFYLDDWGNTVVVVEKKKEFGNPVDQTIIWKDKQTTIYDHAAKTAWSGRSRVKLTEPPAVASLSEDQLTSVGYQKLPNEKIAGRSCAVYENSALKVKYWLWQGIELKVDNKSLGTLGYVREATSVEEGAAIPESLLARPDGYSD